MWSPKLVIYTSTGQDSLDPSRESFTPHTPVRLDIRYKEITSVTTDSGHLQV